MKVMVKATKSSEAGKMPDKKLMANMGKFNEQLVQAGIMQAGEGLKPSSEGVRVHFSGANRTVTDGPFAETNEIVAGYWLWEVQSLDEAIAWVKRCPNPMIEDSDIELRPVYEMEDFAESDPSGELMAEEEQRRKELATQASNSESDEQQILNLMAKWRTALERKDVAAMMEDYTPEAVLFDACPPYKTAGVDGIRKVWETCSPFFPEEFKSEHRDIQVHVNGDVASPLHSVTAATSVRVRDGKRQITDGPFAETTEQLGGYYVIDVDDLDEAIEVAGRIPPAKLGTVEIRPLFPLSELQVGLIDEE